MRTIRWIFPAICLAVVALPIQAVDKEALKAAKSAAESEQSYQYPFGPGDRSFSAQIKLAAGETSANTEVWVLYSDVKKTVTDSKIGDKVPQGKAKIKSVDSQGVVKVSFIFPHSTHPKPNASDVNQRSYAGGKKIYYKLIKKKGTTQFPEEVQEFVMPDKLTIAIMGDSFASGEGAPYKSGSLWDNAPAHRSNNSSKARAVIKYKQDHPETAIVVVNVASSGAGINEGINGSQLRKQWYDSSELHATPVGPQVTQVKNWLSENNYDTVNIVMISIGINEIFFGDIVPKYFLGIDALDLDASARNVINTKINELAIGYQTIKDNFDRSFDYDYVHVSEYPDPTHWKNGKFCGTFGDIHGLCWGPAEGLSGAVEYEIAYDFLIKMNSTIKTKIEKFTNWEMVEGARAKSKEHGLCNCDEPWFNTLGASLTTQFDANGTWHPNRAGHEAFMPFELNAINSSVMKLRAKHAREHAIELAKEKAKAKLKLAQNQQLVLAPLSKQVVPKVTISPEVLQKINSSPKSGARDTSGTDSKDTDNNEK